MGRILPTNPLRRLTFPYRAPATPRGVEPARARPNVGADYDTDWARREPARLARAAVIETVIRPAMAGIARPERNGADRLDSLTGPVIFAANHHSHLDTPLLLSSLPPRWRHRVVVGAAADYFFGTRATGAVSALLIGAIPIERQKVGRRSADLARSLIDDGWSLVIFPEGGRSPDGWGQPFRGGAAYLALRCGVPVVPVHLVGTGRILGKGRSLPRPARTTVTFGSPLQPVDGEDSRRFAARIERAVAVLADEVATDWWQARRRAHAEDSPSLTGPDVGAWRRLWALGGNDGATRRRTRRWPRI